MKSKVCEYSEEQIKKENGTILSMDKSLSMDLSVITNEILTFVLFIEKNKKLEEEDAEEFKKMVDDNFQHFMCKYNNMYTMLIDKKNRKENLLQIIKLIKLLKNMQDGNISYDDGFDLYKNDLLIKYMKPIKKS